MSERDNIARIIRAAYEEGLSSINGDACFEQVAADRILTASRTPAQRERPAIQFDVERYVADYEFRGDKGDYSPSDVERELLIDAIHGVVHEINQSFPTEATALTEGQRGCITTEQLDKLQFGRVLHERPEGNRGCGTPGCTDPNCAYGAGTSRCQKCGHPLPTTEGQLGREALDIHLRALNEFVTLSEEDYCSDDTEEGEWAEPDDEPVAAGTDHVSNVTFGSVRRAREAIDALLALSSTDRGSL